MTDLCQLPAHHLVALMTGGTVSCREVVQAHLARIDEVNPALNALVQAADPQQCLTAADQADSRVARGAPVGRAHGLPVVVKDVMHVAGLECSGGSPVLRATAESDATAVSRLRAEGAIVLGLTNVPEMGRGGESNNNLYGRTNNPFDLSRTPGGSSGGSAALVSAGGAALSVGSDGGGSIRQPAHNTGIAGLKPTHGRIPRTGSVFGDAFGIFGPFNCYGPLARTVRRSVPRPVDHERPRSARSVRGARAARPPGRRRPGRAAGRHISRQRHLASGRRHRRRRR